MFFTFVLYIIFNDKLMILLNFVFEFGSVLLHDIKI